jgi:hypothetical protein
MLAICAGVFPRTLVASGLEPTYAKKAVAFPEVCRELHDFPNCKAMQIPSPDGKSSVQVFYKKLELDREKSMLLAFLRVTTPVKGTREVGLPDGFQDIDLLWSPDSRAFFLNGGNGGGYWGFWVYVFRVDGDSLEALNITPVAQKDMLRLFPPCKAMYLDSQTCKSDEDDPEYNMSAIDWLADSSAILVMAEVPCSSSYGGIMCQVMGYELEVPTGKILKRIDAKHLKLDWQRSMAWKFRVPDPPEYRK